MEEKNQMNSINNQGNNTNTEPLVQEPPKRKSIPIWIWVVVGLVIITLPSVIAWRLLSPKPTSEIVPEVETEARGSEKSRLTYFTSILDTETRGLGKAHELWQKDNYLFVTSIGDQAVEVLDVSDPANPQLVGVFYDNDETSMRSPHSIMFSGNYAYVSANADGAVQVLDVSDPANLVPVTAVVDDDITGLGGVHALAKNGNYLYVLGTVESALEVLDISNPANPVHAAVLYDNEEMSLSAPHSIAFKGNYAYVVGASEGMEVLDISDPTNPIHVMAIPDSEQTALLGGHDVDVIGNYLYVTAIAEGFEVFDVSDPARPVHVAALFAAEGNGLLGANETDFASDRYAFVTSEGDNALVMIDISTPTNPVIVDVIYDDGSQFLTGGHHVRVIGNYVYVAGLKNGFAIVRFSE